MKVLISKINDEVVGINIPPTSLSYEIDLDDSVVVSKVIQVIEEDSPIDKTVTLQDRPDAFTATDVLEAKYSYILENSECNYIIADGLINCDDIELSSTQANTGVNILQLLPRGYAETKEVKIEVSSKTFKILELDLEDGVDVYINYTKVVDNEVVLDTDVDKVIISFVNTTDKFKHINSYAIGY
jgi:hypothetical protein